MNLIINLFDFPSKRSFDSQHYSRLCFTINYSRTSTGKSPNYTAYFSPTSAVLDFPEWAH